MNAYLALMLTAVVPPAVRGAVDAYRARQSAVTARAAAKAREAGR